MQLYIKLLRHPDTIRNTLQRDGWVIEEEQGNALRATHEQVRDEATARRRLCPLGLLTASSLQIRFSLLPIK